MANPFPGMDPWMEQQWGDAHHRMITYASEQIRTLLPPGLRARIEERVFVESEHGDGTSRYPDLRVYERTRLATRRPAAAPAVAGNVAVAEPLVIVSRDEPVTQGFIQIVDARSGGRVVTVIEVLSPSNKRRGAGQDQYLGKQEECRRAGVNTVEIDLLRGGDWTVAVPRDLVPEDRLAAYKVCVWRAARPLMYELYPLALRDRLPAIRVPLREGDPDAPLDLQPLLDRAHETGDYDDTDYDADPVPPLPADDAAWADGVLREKGLRT